MSGELDQAAGTVGEHVAAAGLAAQARPSRPAALEPDVGEGQCANCTTALQGPVCHVCGQVDDTYHRSIGALLRQMADGVFNLDGRIARTLPLLLLRPGRLTHSYLKGARARFIAPFRLYIVASLIFFLMAGLAAGDLIFSGDSIQLKSTEQARREILEQLARGEITAAEAEEAVGALDVIDRTIAPLSVGSRRDAPVRGEAAPSGAEASPSETAVAGEDGALGAFLQERAERVMADPSRYADATLAWVPRMMFLLVPVYAGLVALTYLWRRGYFFFDHLIASLHLHSALFLAMAAGLLLAPLIGAGWVVALLFVYSNVYVYRMHRVIYSRSRVTSALRTVVLDLAYMIVMAIALVAVLILGFFSL